MTKKTKIWLGTAACGACALALWACLDDDACARVSRIFKDKDACAI